MLIENEDKRFWDGVAEGSFALQLCKECGKHQFPPGPTCWRCGGDDLEWHALEGEIRGTVYTWTVVHRSFMEFKDQVPYTVVIADLDAIPEVRILARLMDEGDGKPSAIGAPVRLRIGKDAQDRPTYGWESR